jgi:hypothetical protein
VKFSPALDITATDGRSLCDTRQTLAPQIHRSVMSITSAGRQGVATAAAGGDKQVRWRARLGFMRCRASAVDHFDRITAAYSRRRAAPLKSHGIRRSPPRNRERTAGSYVFPRRRREESIRCDRAILIDADDRQTRAVGRYNVIRAGSKRAKISKDCTSRSGRESARHRNSRLRRVGRVRFV